MILVSVTYDDGHEYTTEEFWIKEVYRDSLFDRLNELSNLSIP